MAAASVIEEFKLDRSICRIILVPAEDERLKYEDDDEYKPPSVSLNKADIVSLCAKKFGATSSKVIPIMYLAWDNYDIITSMVEPIREHVKKISDKSYEVMSLIGKINLVNAQYYIDKILDQEFLSITNLPADCMADTLHSIMSVFGSITKIVTEEFLTHIWYKNLKSYHSVIYAADYAGTNGKNLIIIMSPTLFSPPEDISKEGILVEPDDDDDDDDDGDGDGTA